MGDKGPRLARVRRPVYGLDDAGILWWFTCTQWLREHGMRQLRLDPNVFVLDGPEGIEAVLGLHVDDFAAGGQGARWEKILGDFGREFPLRKV